MNGNESLSFEKALKVLSTEFPDVDATNIEEVFKTSMGSALAMAAILRRLENIEHLLSRRDLTVRDEIDLVELTPSYRCKLCAIRVNAPDILRKIHTVYATKVVKGFGLCNMFRSAFEERGLALPSGQSFNRHCKLHVCLSRIPGADTLKE